jgi:hypothetical protein
MSDGFLRDDDVAVECLFEEPGTLEQVALLARQWFTDHLTPILLPL